MQLHIDSEFKNLIPPLTDEEYKQLEENVVKEGCRDSLVVWNGTIIDGHNRYEICNKHNIEFKTTDIELETKEDAIEWIIRNQFGRRNLPKYERARLALRLEPIVKDKAKENQGKRTDICQNSDKGFNSIDTKKELADVAGVSHNTIWQVGVIENEGSKEVQSQARKGEISINKAFNLTRPKIEPVEETKICIICGEEKPTHEIVKGMNECKKCHADRARLGLTLKQVRELNKEYPLDELNKIYEDMKSPTTDNAEVGQNEKYIHESIISEFEKVLNDFNSRLHEFIDSPETKTKKISEQVSKTIDNLKQLLI